MKKKKMHPVHMLLLLASVMVLSWSLGNSLLSAETAASSQAGDSAVVPAQQNDPQEKDKEKEKDASKSELYYEVTVTATRTRKDTFEVPKAVNVMDRKKIEEKAPNNVTELLLDQPGVDVNGVGANQSRPVIRGLRGQRILLMEDGIRMNNSRRQQDFGEIPALVDISEVDRVEVVRGPASVLYGSDAIGGVVNILTRDFDYSPTTSTIHGHLGYRYSSAERQNKGMASVNGNIGRLGFMAGGNYRNAGDYMAPAGTFGKIRLNSDVKVNDTGVKDGGANLQLSYLMSEQSRLSFKYEYYRSENSGFGFVEPALYDPGSARVQILYPMQSINKFSFRYEHRELQFALADHVEFVGYRLSNERKMAMNIFVPFNIPRMPDAGIEIKSDNYSDVNTMGFRLELNKALSNHTLTYGFDFFNDHSENNDYNATALVGFGPPIIDENHTPLVPNATYRSLGGFIQDDVSLFKRTSLIFGVRYQNVNASTKETPGLEGQPLFNSTDETLVGTANLSVGITDNLRVVLSVGRGFRSPNLIERFYNGATPEGSGFQSRNTGLKAETSLNTDIGFKYRYNNVYLEATFFNNVVKDGIRIAATGNEISGLPEYRNVNVDKLRMRGIEALGRVYFNFGVSTQANLTWIKSKDLGSPETPYVDTYSLKFNWNIRYDHPGKLFWLSYDFRLNGDQKDVQLVENPIGDIIPGFTVHSVSAGITLFRKSAYPQRLGIVIGNLTNVLYSEFSNASFFRPAPRRYIVLTWATQF